MAHVAHPYSLRYPSQPQRMFPVQEAVSRGSMIAVADVVLEEQQPPAHPCSSQPAGGWWASHRGMLPTASTLHEPTEGTQAQAATDPARDMGAALHEVSNALTVILGWLGRGQELRHDPEEVERALRIAAGRASQARAIVRRAIGADVEEDPERAVADVVADIVTGLEPELRRAGITGLVTIADTVKALPIAHVACLAQILTNLILNAVAMAPPASTVGIDARVIGYAGVD